ncbi:MAG: hypothetical protein KAF91_30070 [Nostoc sp. TH1S01]|nr:hypothetical protein [Nostoc sp. TH1S01]
MANAVNATQKLHKLVGLKITPPLKKTSTIPSPSNIQPKFPVCLGKKTSENMPAMIARTEPVAGTLR